MKRRKARLNNTLFSLPVDELGESSVTFCQVGDEGQVLLLTLVLAHSPTLSRQVPRLATQHVFRGSALG